MFQTAAKCRVCDKAIPQGGLFCSTKCSIAELWAEEQARVGEEDRQKQISKIKKRGADELAKLEVTVKRLTEDEK